MALDTRRLQELAGKHACEGIGEAICEQSRRLASNAIFTSDSGQLKLAGFDDDCDWSDNPPPGPAASTLSVKTHSTQLNGLGSCHSPVQKGLLTRTEAFFVTAQTHRKSSEHASVQAAGPADLRCTPAVKSATEMELVSPLVRSIFEGRKRTILDAGQKVISKKGGGILSQIPLKDRQHVGQEYGKATLNKKVQALDEEIAIFKKESKRVKNLAKEHEDGLTRLAREKAEWEQQKKSQVQAFQAQQEEQMEKLKRDKQILDHRSVTLNIMPAAQRKEVEELKEALAKEQEEHRGKEMRLRLTLNRMKAMNEDLTKQVLELQDEIRRYEGCLLSALDSCCGGHGLQPQTLMPIRRPCGEPNHSHAHAPPKSKSIPVEVSLRGGGGANNCKGKQQCSTDVEEGREDDANSRAAIVEIEGGELCPRGPSTSKFFSSKQSCCPTSLVILGKWQEIVQSK